MKPLTLKHCFIIAIAATLLTCTYKICIESNHNSIISNLQSKSITPCLDNLLDDSDSDNPIATINYNKSTFSNLMTD